MRKGIVVPSSLTIVLIGLASLVHFNNYVIIELENVLIFVLLIYNSMHKCYKIIIVSSAYFYP